MTTLPMVCFVQTVKQLKCDNPSTPKMQDKLQLWTTPTLHDTHAQGKHYFCRYITMFSNCVLFSPYKRNRFERNQTHTLSLNTPHSHQDHKDIQLPVSCHGCFTSTERFPCTLWIGGWLGPRSEKLL